MTATDIGIAGTATWFPSNRESSTEAVRTRRLAPADAREADYLSLPVEAERSAPEMAVLAARRALAVAGCPGDRVGLVAHAWTYHQGHDFWSPAHYVARGAGAVHAVPIGVQQMCNGSAAGVELAVARLGQDAAVDTALACCADRFTRPGFDRWSGDYGLWYGDAAAAAVMHRGVDDDDALELMAIATAAAPDLEDMHRGDDGFSAAPRTRGDVVDIRRTKKAFLEAGRGAAFAAAVDRHVRDVLGRCLSAAGVDPDDPRLRRVVLPRLGAKARPPYAAAVASVTPAPATDLGTHTGHLGAGDFLANLAALADDPELLARGETALVLSAGAGFTWTGALVRRPATAPEREGER